MDEQRIASVIRDLDAQVPTDGAVVQLIQYGGGPDESKVVANRLGYFRLGIEFLKGASMAADQGKPSILPISVDYLTDRNSNIVFDSFEYDERLTPEPRADRGATTQHLIAWAVGLALLGVLGLAGIGAFAAVRWITR